MKFVAFERAKQGTGASRRLRNTGRTPGIVYGGTVDTTMIEIDHNALWHAIKKEAFHASVLDMELAGVEHKVLLRDVQMHPFKQLILHIMSKVSNCMGRLPFRFGSLQLQYLLCFL